MGLPSVGAAMLARLDAEHDVLIGKNRRDGIHCDIASLRYNETE
jgi:hypothetical protein